MRKVVEIENIEEMRRRNGLDDVELRADIRKLGIGDFVKITFLADSSSIHPRVIRITSVSGSSFRGKLTDAPAVNRLIDPKQGSLIAFTASHIHSIPKKKTNHEQ